MSVPQITDWLKTTIMKIEQSVDYIGQDNQLTVTIPVSRTLDSYPDEMRRLWGTLRKSVSQTDALIKFDETECNVKLQLRTYNSNKTKRRVHVKYKNVKYLDNSNDGFSAIPEDVLRKVLPLTQISQSNYFNDWTRIKTILEIGYVIEPPL